MSQGLIHQKTGTAADVLSYEVFYHVSRQVDRITRVATASQEFVVRDWDDEKYVVKFHNNFSKKHLFTFSKDTGKTRLEAEAEAGKPGQAGQDAENWHRAEMTLLKGKIAKNLDNRAVAGLCDCGHQYNRHPGGGACNVVYPPIPAPALPPCPCTQFRTPYRLARNYVQKPTVDPIAGASTQRNSCIILNWVPRAQFERVVVESIQGHEKAPDLITGAPWARGNALRVPAAPYPRPARSLVMRSIPSKEH